MNMTIHTVRSSDLSMNAMDWLDGLACPVAFTLERRLDTGFPHTTVCVSVEELRSRHAAARSSWVFLPESERKRYQNEMTAEEVTDIVDIIVDMTADGDRYMTADGDHYVCFDWRSRGHYEPTVPASALGDLLRAATDAIHATRNEVPESEHHKLSGVLLGLSPSMHRARAAVESAARSGGRMGIYSRLRRALASLVGTLPPGTRGGEWLEAVNALQAANGCEEFQSHDAALEAEEEVIKREIR